MFCDDVANEFDLSHTQAALCGLQLNVLCSGSIQDLLKSCIVLLCVFASNQHLIHVCLYAWNFLKSLVKPFCKYLSCRVETKW